MKKHVTLMINSSFYDMLGEYRYFIKEIFPELKRYCSEHNINLDYKDVAFSVPEESFNRQIILQDLRFIDTDRTFFICFRGQRLGWRPTQEDIDGLTLDEYPELVNFIGNVSITELAIMHALMPFDKCIDGEIHSLPTVKHSLFYFRNPNYLDILSDTQLLFYANKSNGEDKEVQDMEIAKAKDLIVETKSEFDEAGEESPRITIRHYDGIWDSSKDMHDVMCEYTQEYENMENKSLDYFVGVHEEYMCKDTSGCLYDFEYKNRPLKEVIIEDIITELKIEFPENFE